MPITGVPSPVQRTEYLFIDGGYLTRILGDFVSRFYPCTEVTIDYKKLAVGFTKVFYYDCEPPQKPGEAQESYELRLSAYRTRTLELSEYAGWHVFAGVTKRQAKRGNVQKEVDVQIAVDLLTHSFRRNMEGAVLMAGDQDFRPVVEAVVREGMYLTLWSDARSTSNELRHAADARRWFDIYTFNDLLPDGVERCPLPQRFAQPSPVYPGELVERAAFQSGASFNLYLTGPDSYFLLSQQRLDGNSYVGYQLTPQEHESPLKAIKKFVELAYGPPSWMTAA